MSGTSTPDPSREQALLAIGRQCSKPSCLLVDFLPFKCQHCEEHFCGEHFLPAGHDCSKYDASKYNRVAPPCPLCNEPIAIPPGQDPNIRMEQHINSQCSVVTGKSRKAKSGPVCSKGKCEKVLFSPIRCTKCRKDFCPQHRFPADHNCVPAPASAGSRLLGGSDTLANLASISSAAKANTVDTLRKTLATSTAGTSSSSSTAEASTPSSSTSKPSTSHRNPFSQTERISVSYPNSTVNATPTTTADSVVSRTSPTLNDNINASFQLINPMSRARAERESRMRALQERARKGLLSAEEKARLAAEEAEDHEEGRACTTM